MQWRALAWVRRRQSNKILLYRKKEKINVLAILRMAYYMTVDHWDKLSIGRTNRKEWNGIFPPPNIPCIMQCQILFADAEGDRLRVSFDLIVTPKSLKRERSHFHLVKYLNKNSKSKFVEVFVLCWHMRACTDLNLKDLSCNARVG